MRAPQVSPLRAHDRSSSSGSKGAYDTPHKPLEDLGDRTSCFLSSSSSSSDGSSIGSSCCGNSSLDSLLLQHSGSEWRGAPRACWAARDSGVGKSSMLLRVTEGPPSGRRRRPRDGEPLSEEAPPRPTVGIDYRSLSLQLDDKRDTNDLEVSREASFAPAATAAAAAAAELGLTLSLLPLVRRRFDSIVLLLSFLLLLLLLSYFRSAMGVMLVFDVSSKTSFLSLEYWLSMMREEAPPHVQLLVVGNKNACNASVPYGGYLCEVTRAEAEGEAARLGFSYMETSAATGEHLHAAFACLTRKVARYIAGLEAGLACSGTGRRRRGAPAPSTPVNEALREGDLDLVAGICLLQQQTPTRSTELQLRRHPMQFRRYAIDDTLDRLCDV
ncbi:hypothetical protein Emed_005188 [Eimeria media]